MKILNRFLIMVLIASPVLAQTEDLSNRFGISGIIGAAFPLGPDYVTAHTNDTGLNLGVQGNFYFSSRMGIGISYESMTFGQGQRVSPIDMLFLIRLPSDREWTPTFQFGGGSAKSINSSRMENANMKAGVGIDWFVAPSVTVGPQLNYIYIIHNGDETTEAHVLAANVVASYYFGSTYTNQH